MAYIPEWFPGAHFQRWARETRRITWDLIAGPFETVKHAVVRPQIRANTALLNDGIFVCS